MAAMYDAMGNYTGDDGVDATVVTPQNVGWFAQKAQDFQVVMNAADTTMQALQTLLTLDISDDDWYTCNDWLNQLYGKRTQMRLTADALNLIAGTVNSFGGELPTVNIPSGLGFPPVVLPALAVSAVVGVTYLVSQLIGIITGSGNAAVQAANNITDPAKRDAALANVAAIEAAQSSVFGTGIEGVSNVLKWLALAVGGFFIYREMSKGKK